MSFALPVGEYAWMTKDELNMLDPMKHEETSDTGYIVEVTLDYPDHLHKNHSSFPLAPEKMSIPKSSLSPYAADCLSQLNKKHLKSEKLTATFNRRERYVCHIMNLKLYLKLGLKLVQIHRGIRFKQEPFLKTYVEMCTRKRANSVTKARSNMFKLLCNSLYGKLIEGTDKRLDCKFNFTRQQAIRRNTNPRLNGTMICDDDFSISFFQKKAAKLNQCWAVGFSILELSKYIMQGLYYEKIKPAFNNEVSVLMSDTDSWILVVNEPSADQAISKIKKIMDLSNYPPSHALFKGGRKNKVGYLKNELPTQEIRRCVMLRSKVYMFETFEGGKGIKCKGVRNSAKKHITMEKFINCLTSVDLTEISQYSIRAKNHINMIVESRKIAFSSYEDKRFLLCPLHSVPYGSIFIRHFKETGDCYLCNNPNELF